MIAVSSSGCLAGTRAGLFLAGLFVGCLAVGTMALAQPVPLPTPAPAPKEGKMSPPASVPQGVPQGAPPAASASGPSTWLDRLFGGKAPDLPSSNLSAFDPGQRALVNKVSAYLTSVQALTGNFVQIGPDGRRATGELFIQKPGKVRFEYDAPSPIDIIADGQSVVVRDRQLSTQDLYPLSQTPLRFLLTDRIDLLRDTNVVGVTVDDTYVTVVIEEKQPLIGTNRLTMMFDPKDYKLKQWTVTDAQGFDTTIAVSNLDSTKRPDPGLFKIDYTRYVQ
jgi:outer membrane lipoprotein-sorting protein